MQDSIQLDRERAMLRFSLREMMMLTLIVGLLIGWWMECRRAQALHLEKILLLGTKRELDMANNQTAFYKEIVDAYRQQGYHSLHDPDGKIRIMHDAATHPRFQQLHRAPKMDSSP